MQTRRLQESFEGSYSSLAYSRWELSRVIASYCSRQWETHAFSDFGSKMFFWAITLVPDMLEGQARSLSTREIILFPTKFLSKILAHWIGVQGPSKLVKKTKTPPLCEPVPGEPLTQIKKTFLLSNQEDLLHP